MAGHKLVLVVRPADRARLLVGATPQLEKSALSICQCFSKRNPVSTIRSPTIPAKSTAKGTAKRHRKRQLMKAENIDVSLMAAGPGQLERIPCQIFSYADDASLYVAGQIADLMRTRAAAGKQCVLGLATGSTPTSIYEELVRLHREEGLSFINVVTFNIDEFYPMEPAELQ
jgi:hypothetical protein